jgi:hypothetical protein
MLAVFLGMGKTVRRIANAATLQEQQQLWNGLAVVGPAAPLAPPRCTLPPAGLPSPARPASGSRPGHPSGQHWPCPHALLPRRHPSLQVRFIKNGPAVLVWAFCKLISLLLCNRLVLWFGGGVPAKQYKLIVQDGIPIEQYVGRTIDGAQLADAWLPRGPSGPPHAPCPTRTHTLHPCRPAAAAPMAAPWPAAGCWPARAPLPAPPRTRPDLRPLQPPPLQALARTATCASPTTSTTTA